MMRLRWAVPASFLVSLLVPVVASAQKAPRRSVAVSIVRPSGSPLDLPVVARLEEELASRRVTIQRVEALRSRMARLTADRTSRAPLELAAARALELEARFREASEHYGAAVRALEEDPRSLYEPRSIAEAELARGAAALQDGDEATALRAMQSALGWVEDLQADPTFSPEARAVLERARSFGATAPGLPSRDALSVATRAAGSRFLVFVAIGGPPSSRVMRTYVAERGRILLDERRPITGRRLEDAAVGAATRIAARISPRIPLPPPPTPFWHSPYFWGAVGAVIAGGAAATLYLTATPQADVRTGRLP